MFEGVIGSSSVGCIWGGFKLGKKSIAKLIDLHRTAHVSFFDEVTLGLAVGVGVKATCIGSRLGTRSDMVSVKTFDFLVSPCFFFEFS